MHKRHPPVHIEIPRRAQCCVIGQEEFMADMDYHSVLVEDAEQGLVRRDFCIDCWDKVDRKEIKTSWKARIPSKKTAVATAHLKREEKAMSLFREVLAQGELADTALLFVLALYLARHKLLVLRQQIEEKENHYFLYEVMATEEIVYVKRVDLTKMKWRVEEVQQQLAQQLGTVQK